MSIEQSCATFARIFHQILSAIYNNPNNFLAKQVLKAAEQDDEAEFSSYVLAYIAGTTEENKLLKRSRKILLKLNPGCGLSISRCLTIDPKGKPKNKEGEIFSFWEQISCQHVDVHDVVVLFFTAV